jgi:hypothetical protein
MMSSRFRLKQIQHQTMRRISSRELKHKINRHESQELVRKSIIFYKLSNVEFLQLVMQIFNIFNLNKIKFKWKWFFLSKSELKCKFWIFNEIFIFCTWNTLKKLRWAQNCCLLTFQQIIACAISRTTQKCLKCNFYLTSKLAAWEKFFILNYCQFCKIFLAFYTNSQSP